MHYKYAQHDPNGTQHCVQDHGTFSTVTGPKYRARYVNNVRLFIYHVLALSTGASGTGGLFGPFNQLGVNDSDGDDGDHDDGGDDDNGARGDDDDDGDADGVRRVISK